MIAGMDARHERVLLRGGGVVAALILLGLVLIAGLLVFGLVYVLFHARR
jgi:hypothetical protein